MQLSEVCGHQAYMYVKHAQSGRQAPAAGVPAPACLGTLNPCRPCSNDMLEPAGASCWLLACCIRPAYCCAPQACVISMSTACRELHKVSLQLASQRAPSGHPDMGVHACAFVQPVSPVHYHLASKLRSWGHCSTWVSASILHINSLQPQQQLQLHMRLLHLQTARRGSHTPLQQQVLLQKRVVLQLARASGVLQAAGLD